MSFIPTRPLLSHKLPPSSKAWLARQFKDPIVRERLSHPAQYRSRSAFKLLELDAQWRFLKHKDSKGDADMSPLHYAAICGILSNGRLLLQRGANTEQVDAKGWTPLWYATRNGDAKFVQVLLYRGSSIERSPDIFGRTIFHYAKESRNERVLQLLQRHLQQNQTTVASPPNSSPGASSNTDSHAGPSLSSGGLSTGDEV